MFAAAIAPHDSTCKLNLQGHIHPWVIEFNDKRNKDNKDDKLKEGNNN